MSKLTETGENRGRGEQQLTAPSMIRDDRPTVPSSPSVYQLRVVLRGISPLVWRRLLVSSDSTIADLHNGLPVAAAQKWLLRR